MQTVDPMEIGARSEWRDWLASPVSNCDDIWVVIFIHVTTNLIYVPMLIAML